MIQNESSVTTHTPTRRGINLIVMSVTAVMVLAAGLSLYVTPASARTTFAAPLCGAGSAPDFGFTYNLQKPLWTVGWQNYASQQAVDDVDAIFDRLDRDSIAQTMILIKPQEQVGDRVNCAVHFLRYMQLGLPTGERKDNGFVFLIVVEPDSIDVHYGVGLGLPALTAPELTNINRAAEDAYQSTHDMDQALLTIAQEFDRVARSKYAPLVSSSPTPQPISLPSGPLGILALCGQLCIGIFFLFFLVWLFSNLGRGGVTFTPGGFGSGGRGGFPLGRLGGRGGGGPSLRGGGGSGRSGRGN
jgi:hypothetical protein